MKTFVKGVLCISLGVVLGLTVYLLDRDPPESVEVPLPAKPASVSEDPSSETEERNPGQEQLIQALELAVRSLDEPDSPRDENIVQGFDMSRFHRIGTEVETETRKKEKRQ